MPDFLPRRDADLVQWSGNFARQLAKSPGVYGVTPEAVAGLVAAQQAFAQKYAAAQSRVTRTPVSVQAKDTAREVMIGEARPLAALVRAQKSTTNHQLIVLGLRSRRKARRGVARPRVAPQVRVGLVEGRRLSVRILERSTGRCRKPKDVSSAVLMYWCGDSLPREASAWRLWGVTGRLREVVELSEGVPPGTKVWLTAFWQNERHDQGPWAMPTMAWVGFDVRPTMSGLRRAG